MKTFLKTLAIIYLFSFPLLATSQSSPIIDWQNTIGGNGQDQITVIQQTSDGGYIIGGITSSGASCDKTEPSMGLSDIWLVRLDANGTVLWENTIGGSNVDDLNGGLIITSDGGFLLAGASMSGISGDKTEGNMGIAFSYDYWIIKTDSIGNIQWQNTIGGASDDIPSSVCQTPDGGYMLGGFSISPLSGDKTENDIGGSDFWIVKTDSFGNVQWDNTIGGISEDRLVSIVSTNDGGFMIGGTSSSSISGDKSENCIGQQDYWIVKTDSSGTIQWQNTIGGTAYEELTSIASTNDEGYILGGNSNSGISGDKSEASLGSLDFWIVKTDSLGNIQWENTIGGNDIDDVGWFQQTNNSEYILFGSSISGISGDKTEAAYASMDYWIVKLDTNGGVIWDKTIGGTSDDFVTQGQITASGELIFGGYSFSPISGDKTENVCNNSCDFWVVHLTTDYNSITGTLYYDVNSNQVRDANEFPVVYKTVLELNSGRMAFTDATGLYNISVPDTGNFEVSPANISYYNPSPANHLGNFPILYLTDSLNDFAFQPTGTFNDVCVNLTPMTPFRPGMPATYHLYYLNSGTTSQNTTLMFYPDANLSFVSSNLIPSGISNDSIVWSLGMLGPGQSGSILVGVEVDMIPSGTAINSSAFIEPLTGDVNPGCNYASWEVFVTGSYDPNDIIVNEDTLLTTLFPNPPFLEYIIRFQNTGNDTAFTVKVLNPIDTFKLDLSSIEFVTSSHPVNLTWIPWERNMEFRFENILLPDSNVNEPASHGFIRYRIKPKSTLAAGDSITNSAAIYFDFNAPVITNTAITYIVLPTSLHEISATSDQLVLYPNPANSTLTIVTGTLATSECRLIISDMAGRTLFSKPITTTSQKHTLDISSLSRGIYFVQLQEGERILRGKFVRE